MNITGSQEQIFVQGELLKVLKETYGESAEEQENFKHIKGGICFMLSIEWLLKLLELPNAYPASIYDPRFDDPKTAIYYKQIADNYYKYSADWKYTFRGLAEHPTAEQMADTRIVDINNRFVELCSKEKYTVPGTFHQFTAATDITGMYAGNCALLLCIIVNPIMPTPTVKAFGHAMALWRYNGQSYFYDPNEGVFQLPDFSRIVGEIINGYTMPVPGGATAALTITEINKK